MPELPEVETIARQLDGVINNQEIEKVDVLKNVSFQGNPRELEGKTIEKIDRHAKMIIWHIKNLDKVVMIHLKMTGQLIFDSKKNVGSTQHTVVGGHPTDDWVKQHPTKHTRVVVKFKNDGVLYFNDLRMFGWMKLITKDEFKQILAKLPPDVNTKEFSLEYLNKVVNSSGRPIKVMVMDSTKIGGAGNIYANDALNKAKIDPRKRSKDLIAEERERLFSALKEVIDEGIRYGGASAHNYVHVSGLGGHYQDHFLVYGREGEKCKNCGSKIEKIFLGGRGTFFCPNCQK
jgi:formamidopyrimidine-DNA glycosylase